MDPEATAKRLFDTGHISEVEFDWLLKFAMSTEKKSRAMVTKMLWQRSFENVPNVLRTKNEQGQIALEKLSELISKIDTKQYLLWMNFLKGTRKRWLGRRNKMKQRK